MDEYYFKYVQETREAITIHCFSDFPKILNDLLDSNVLDDHEAVMKDIENDERFRSMQFLLGKFNKGQKVNERQLCHSAVRASRPDLSTKDMLLYISLVVSLTYARHGSLPHKEIMNNLIDEVMNFRKVPGKNGETCKFLFQIIVQFVDLDMETYESLINISLQEMSELLEISKLKNTEKSKMEIRKDFNWWLKTTSFVLIHLKSREEALVNFERTSVFVKFYLKLYKMFKNKTYIEATEDLCEFKLIVLTIERMCFVFEFQSKLIVKHLINHWPTSFICQKEVISTFMRICNNLNDIEKLGLKEILVKKLNDLFLYSHEKVFSVAYAAIQKECPFLKKFWSSQLSESNRSSLNHKTAKLIKKIVENRKNDLMKRKHDDVVFAKTNRIKMQKIENELKKS